MEAKKRKKVVIFINNLNYGGAQKIAAILLFKLQEYFDIYLLLLNDKEIVYELPSNINIHLLEGSNIFSSSSKFKSFCKKNKIDVCLSLLTKPNYIAVLSKVIGNKSKILISEHTFQSLWRSNEFLYSQFKKLTTYLSYNQSNKVITVSKKIQEDLRTKFKINSDRLTTIYNPYDIAEIKKKSEETLQDNNVLSKDSFRFISVGTLYHVKNHELLIKSFSRLEGLKFELIIIGDGVLREKLENLICELEMKDKVKFLGFQSNPFKYLRLSDVFVLSSNNEGLPNVIIEALACGCAVISTDCTSGPREILAPNTDINKQIKNDIEFAKYGILVPIKNDKKLSEAIEIMLKNPEIYNKYKSISFERALDFDASISIKNYVDLIESV